MAQPWTDRSTHRAVWDERTAILAGLIERGSTVLDVGSGRGALEGMLPPGCMFSSLDLTGADFCADLNGPLPDLPLHDVAVLGGVLEYVEDVGRLFRHLAQCCVQLVGSYGTTDRFPYARARQASGWVNAHSRAELFGLLRSAGFVPEAAGEWRNHLIWVAK